MKCDTSLALLRLVPLATAVALLLANVSAAAQRGHDAEGFDETMGLAKNGKASYSCQYLKSTAPANILWPGEQAAFTFQLTNNSEPDPSAARARWKSSPTAPSASRAISRSRCCSDRDADFAAIAVDIGPQKSQTITVKPNVPEQLGGYALVVDLGKAGRQLRHHLRADLQARSDDDPLPADHLRRQTNVDVIARLGVVPTAWHSATRPTTDAAFRASTFAAKCGTT